MLPLTVLRQRWCIASTRSEQNTRRVVRDISSRAQPVLCSESVEFAVRHIQ